jgi:hypothetical protein
VSSVVDRVGAAAILTPAPIRRVTAWNSGFPITPESSKATAGIPVFKTDFNPHVQTYRAELIYKFNSGGFAF